MHRFWQRYTKRIVETLAPRRIIEVGAEFGWNTQHLLAYCRETGGHLHIIDPAPHPALHDVRASRTLRMMENEISKKTSNFASGYWQIDI